MSPTIYSETDGRYLGMDEAIHTVPAGQLYYSDMSLWDTYRTQHPWLVIAQPAVAADLARSLTTMYLEGGSMPRWFVLFSLFGVVPYFNSPSLGLGRLRTSIPVACSATMPTWSCSIRISRESLTSTLRPPITGCAMRGSFVNHVVCHNPVLVPYPTRTIR